MRENSKPVVECSTEQESIASHLCSCCGSVAVEFGVGLDVVGVYRQGLCIQLVGSFIVAVLKGLVAFLLLGF